MVLYSGASLETMAPQLPTSFQGAVVSSSAKITELAPSFSAHMNAASLIALLYLAYYALLDVSAAILITPVWVFYYFIAFVFVRETPNSLSLSVIVFIASWIAQFYGHGVHEGRAPALLDNLLGAVVLAPLFVYIELLFYLGYRPELQKWLKNETGRLLAEFRRQHPKHT